MKKSIVYLGVALCTAIGAVSMPSVPTAIYEVSSSKPTVTPLCTAIGKGENDVIKKLIAYGVDVNERSNGMTPLMLAARYNNLEIVQLLLDNGANPRAKSPNGMTAEKWAEAAGAKEAAALLKNFDSKKTKSVRS